MATSDIHLTVLQIINKTLRRLRLDPITSLSDSSPKRILLCLDLLNEIISEISDYGDWQEMFRSVLIPISAGQGSYKVSASAEIKNIMEISNSARGISPLQVVDIPTIRRLQRIGQTGTPTQFAVVGVSGTRPRFAPWPVPGANEATTYFNVAFYKKPRLYTTSDANTVVPFPGEVVYLGLYAKMLANETGDQTSNEYQISYTEFMRARKEALNRYTSDTGTDVQFVLGGQWS